jgi:hypothetical protein
MTPKAERALWAWTLLVGEPFVIAWVWNWFVAPVAHVSLTWPTAFALNVIATVLIMDRTPRSDVDKGRHAREQAERVVVALWLAALVRLVTR